ncbi:TonB-dependent receptor [Sphingomonas panacisoli]|uniref:TonB-dependent receptor n=1 Tax=Sphingomonas panacisoli TaxID=1813879 RepID=A0A5B8LLJ0_9SPHN|nr:TonB-dependent receptor [Sphingomonas panacisoli]QDZ07920.1 TonB-dependent receptor [Sphingomonas panacisoli]
MNSSRNGAKTTKRVRMIGACSLLAIACGMASPAAAQTAPAASDDQTAAAPQDADTNNGNTPTDIVIRGRFVNDAAVSATKMDIRILDTPASTESYNNNFLKAIETTNVSDLYRYMTGVQRAGNTSYDITFRGFKTSGNDRGAILTDGLPGLSVRFGSPPTIGTDHIELVKGPTAVLYGQGQPGGFINIISKKPKFTPSFEIGFKGVMGVGSYDRQLGGLFSFDYTGPVDKDQTLAVRVVGELGYTRGFRKNSYEQPIYISPSATWKISSKDTLTIGGEYRYVKTHYDTYLVAPGNDASLIAKIDTNYQGKDDYLVERGAIGNLYYTHNFSDSVKFYVGYRYVDHEDRQRNFDVNAFASSPNQLTTITRRARGQLNQRTYSFVDTNLTAKFEIAGIKNNVLIGFNGGQETASLNRTQFYNCTPTPAPACTSLNLNVYNPAINTAPAIETFPQFNTGQSSNLNWRYTTQNSLGGYASDLISFGDFVKVMVGVRYADERQTISDKRITTFVPVKKKDSKWLPQAGLLIEPTKQLTIYAAYSSSYVPVAAASFDVFGLNPFKPTEAKSYEGGVKANLFGERLNLTAAYFDIERKNVLNTFSCPANLAALNAFIAANGITIPANAPRDAAGNLIPASGTCSNQLGSDRSRGFEIEVNATPLPGWQITGGYAHTKARVVSSNIAPQIGARQTNSPDNALNFWTRYDIQSGSLENLGFGLGVSYIGKRVGLLPTVGAVGPEAGTLPLKAYTTVDAGIYYKVGDNLDLTLKVTNLLDARYIESAGFTANIQLVPGTPRLLTATARFHF